MALTRILTTQDSIKFESANMSTEQKAAKKLISVSFRQPARTAACFIPAEAWQALTNSIGASSHYLPLLDAVLISAAKRILSRRIGDMSVFPSEIDDSIFSGEAILSEATSSNTEWISKEDLLELFAKSATMAKFKASPKYGKDKAFTKALDALKERIGKLSGKTSQFTPEELDKLIVYLHPDDLETDMGAFILRRIEQIRNRPAPATDDMSALD
jgi:hypothetical protein